jgi:DNA modification methylase
MLIKIRSRDKMNLLPVHHTIDIKDKIYNMDALSFLKSLPSNYAQCCVTSPPYYGLRDYGNNKQIGLENTLQEYIDNLAQIFEELRRVLKDDGTFWLNLGDSFNGSGKSGGKGGLPTIQKNRETDDKSLKPKDLMLVPHRVAIALQDAGWWVRMDNVWHKPNPMPESVKDRPTKAHEYVFLLTKSAKYYYDRDAVSEPLTQSTIERYKIGWDGNKDREYPSGNHNNFDRFFGSDSAKKSVKRGANRKSVWSITTKSYKGAHFATFPPDIPEICIKAGSRPNDIVLDMFMGAGTVGLVAKRLNRHYIGSEINTDYIAMAEKRIATDWEANQLPLFE